MAERPTIVIGAGIAGLTTARELCRARVPVLLLSSGPAADAESAARHDGIDAALGGEDSVEQHLEDLLEAAGGTGHRAALEALARAAPSVVESLGIPLERDRKGRIALSKLPGSRTARTAHAGARTAMHLSRRLSRELLAQRASGLLESQIGHDLVDMVLDDSGRVVGVVTRAFASGEHHAFAADGVCLATGGAAGLFSGETYAAPALGAAMGVAVRRGARLGRGRGVSPAPFAYTSGGFMRRLPARLAALGAKVDAGILDLSDLDRAPLRRAVGTALDACSRHTGRDGYSVPIPMLSAPDRSLFGLDAGFCEDVDAPENHATSLAGLWAVGGVIDLYFGEAPASGTPLLAALVGAERAARALRTARGSTEPRATLLEDARQRAARRAAERLEVEGDTETPFELRAELSSRGQELDCDDFERRLARAGLKDDNSVANASLRLWFELEAALGLWRALGEVS